MYPAQLAVKSSPTNIADARSARSILAVAATDRLFPATLASPASPIAKINKGILADFGNEPLDGTSVAPAPGVCTVKVVATAPPAGVTLGGLKPQFAPAGKPEHASATASLNPFLGVTVIVKVPEAPFATLRDELLIVSE
jgi:hypothetical protein